MPQMTAAQQIPLCVLETAKIEANGMSSNEIISDYLRVVIID